jgi:hypothetical protein
MNKALTSPVFLNSIETRAFPIGQLICATSGHAPSGLQAFTGPLPGATR